VTAPFQQGRTGYQTYLQALVPTAFQDAVGQAFVGALASGVDAAIDRIAQSVKAKLSGLSPADALAAVGAERIIERGPNETDAAYVARLQGAWDTWPWAGTPYGMLQAFKGLGYPNTGVVIAQVRGGRVCSLDAGGNLVVAAAGNALWCTDSLKDPYGSPYDQPFWSKFDVIFVSPFLASWGAGATLPGSSSDEVNRIRRLIAAWKPAHATCNRIAVLTTSKWWGYPVSQVWGAAGNWGGGAATYWTP
jgi:hypothetical protein